MREQLYLKKSKREIDESLKDWIMRRITVMMKETPGLCFSLVGKRHGRKVGARKAHLRE